MNSKNPSRKAISQELIDEIRASLDAGKPVRQPLPMGGMLNIDRTLPFLIVYRKPSSRPDPGTDTLVNGEASFLMASAEPGQARSLSKLVRTIAATLTEKCKSFLIIEIWSNEDIRAQIPKNDLIAPSFRVVTSSSRPPTYSVEALKDALKKIVINRRKSVVNVIYSSQRAPEGLAPLIPPTLARTMNCFILGLEIYPIYFDSDGKNLFPLALRRLHLGLSSALKKTVFAFSIKRTSIKPVHYLALGKRSLVRAVWDVDKKLSEIGSQFDFLLMVTPVNYSNAWATFKKNRYEKTPALYYRLRPVDPALLKRKLYEVPIDRVEDPVLGNLFREKRTELARKLTMLEDRNTPQFIYSNLQLYGKIDDALYQTAQQILNTVQPHSRNGRQSVYMNAAQFAEKARQEIEYYRTQYKGMEAKVHVRDDVVGLLVTQGNLLINNNLKITEARSEALLQHEVGTHVLTYYNAKAQPLKLLTGGLPGYEELQEGLAVLAEYLVGGLSKPRIRLLAGRVIAARAVIEGASLIETFRILNKDYGFERKTAFGVTVRLHRGGGFTKDAIYLRGLVQLIEYLKGGGDLQSLYIGKLAFEHIPIIQELRWRQVLHPTPILPRYLDESQISDKLKFLQSSTSILDLIAKQRSKL